MTEIKPFLNQSQKILAEDAGMYDPLYKPTAAKASPTKARSSAGGFFQYDTESSYKEFGPQEPIEVIPDEIVAEMAPGRTIDDYEISIIRTIRWMNRWFSFKQKCSNLWGSCKFQFSRLAFWQQPKKKTTNAMGGNVVCWQDRHNADQALRNMERVLKCYNQFKELFSFTKDEALSEKWASFILSIKDFRHYESSWVKNEKQRYKEDVSNKLASLPLGLRKLLPTPNDGLELSEKKALFDETSKILERALNVYYSGLLGGRPQKIEPQEIENFFNDYAKTTSV